MSSTRDSNSLAAAPAVLLYHNLKRLAVLRILTILMATLGYLTLGLEGSPPTQKLAIWSVLFFMSLLSVANLRRKIGKGGQERSLEIFFYLLLDLLLIAVLVYFSGGANNPFITYLLVPIVISAATLPWYSTWILASLGMLLYGFLLFFYQPLVSLNLHLEHSGLSLHIIGMWLTFVLSSSLIAYFVVDMAMDLQKQIQDTARYREKNIQNEHILLLANQAASTAHEIGTPLTTMQMINSDLLKFEENLSPQTKQDLELMAQQISVCKTHLQSLTSTSLQTHAAEQPLNQFLNDTLQQWLLLSPHSQYKWLQDITQFDIIVRYPPTVQQALINLLQNAFDANDAKPIEINMSVDNTAWILSIFDTGSGTANELQKSMENGLTASQAQSKTNSGLGLGLLLSHNGIERQGGYIQFIQREPQGICTQITMPLNPKQAV